MYVVIKTNQEAFLGCCEEKPLQKSASEDRADVAEKIALGKDLCLSLSSSYQLHKSPRIAEGLFHMQGGPLILAKSW